MSSRSTVFFVALRSVCLQAEGRRRDRVVHLEHRLPGRNEGVERTALVEFLALLVARHVEVRHEFGRLPQVVLQGDREAARVCQVGERGVEEELRRRRDGTPRVVRVPAFACRANTRFAFLPAATSLAARQAFGVPTASAAPMAATAVSICSSTAEALPVMTHSMRRPRRARGLFVTSGNKRAGRTGEVRDVTRRSSPMETCRGGESNP